MGSASKHSTIISVQVVALFAALLVEIIAKPRQVPQKSPEFRYIKLNDYKQSSNVNLGADYSSTAHVIFRQTSKPKDGAKAEELKKGKSIHCYKFNGDSNSEYGLVQVNKCLLRKVGRNGKERKRLVTFEPANDGNSYIKQNFIL